MVSKLRAAFSEAEKLSPQEQEMLAAHLLEELASERRWSEAFACSQDQLGELADEALAEYRRGETRPFEADRDLADD